jgi:superfamily II DNA/RNA helicase
MVDGADGCPVGGPIGSDPFRALPRGPPILWRAAPDAHPNHERGTVLNTHSSASTFADLGVLPATIEALAAVGITHPFPIQSLTLPVALHGHDIIGQAKTGTGKTLGFGIPLLQRVVAPGEEGYDALAEPGKPQALVVVPTRELCVQVAGDLVKASATRTVRILSIYGGRAYEPQLEALRAGVDVIVGTPGRLIDLAQQGHLNLGNARTLVLDEADEMLDLGFLPDVEKIVRLAPAGRQTMLFSATMPGAIITLARQYMHHPTHIRAVDPDDDGLTVKAVEQHAFRAHAMDKVEMLARILQAEGRGLTIVFCRTKRTAAKVADELVERGFAAGAVHGDLGQGAREQALRAFRSGKVDILVATDVAARGIDVADITHVINFDAPGGREDYVHRIGRTARAGASGVGITFVLEDQAKDVAKMAHDLGLHAELEQSGIRAHTSGGNGHRGPAKPRGAAGGHRGQQRSGRQRSRAY